MAHLLLDFCAMIEVMTIGYEGMRPEEFLHLLMHYDVERIIDVRELAISRKKGFAKLALTASLATVPIAYTHMAILGCPREIRHAYRVDGDWAEYSRKFAAYLKKRDQALRDLLEFVQVQRCCLLCYEADFNFCHRSFVAERLGMFANGLRIRHLTGPIQDRVVTIPIMAAA